MNLDNNLIAHRLDCGSLKWRRWFSQCKYLRCDCACCSQLPQSKYPCGTSGCVQQFHQVCLWEHESVSDAAVSPNHFSKYQAHLWRSGLELANPTSCSCRGFCSWQLNWPLQSSSPCMCTRHPLAPRLPQCEWNPNYLLLRTDRQSIPF